MDDVGPVDAAIRCAARIVEVTPNPPPSRRTFTLLPVGEILQPIAPQWLVRGFLEFGRLGVVFGAAGSYKTTLVLGLVHAIATGSEFAGFQAIQRPVVYIAGEGRGGLGKRFKALEQETGVNIADGFLHVSNSAAQLLDPESARDVIEAVAALSESPGLIVIDTLSRNFGPGSENDSRDMSTFVGIADQITNATGATVLIVHHTGVEVRDRSRGSSVLNAAADFEFKVQRESDDRVSLSCTKMKDFEEPAQLVFAVRQVDLPEEWGDDWSPGTSVVLDHVPGVVLADKAKALSSSQIIAREALIEAVKEDGRLPESAVLQKNKSLTMGQRVAHIDLWRQIAYRRGVSDSDSQDAKQKAFARSVKALQTKKLVGRDGDWCWPIYKREEPGQTGQDRTKSGPVRDHPSPDRPDTPL